MYRNLANFIKFGWNFGYSQPPKALHFSTFTYNIANIIWIYIAEPKKTKKKDGLQDVWPQEEEEKNTLSVAADVQHPDSAAAKTFIPNQVSEHTGKNLKK
jgi:hypothetical protein